MSIGNKKTRNYLLSIKESYPLTKGLSDEQLGKYSNEELKGLMIQWLNPSESLKMVTGYTRLLHSPNKKTPPPSIYAFHQEIGPNLEKISNYWKMNIPDQTKLIEQYDNMSIEHKLYYHYNAVTMVYEQFNMLKKLEQTDNKPSASSIDTHFSNLSFIETSSNNNNNQKDCDTSSCIETSSNNNKKKRNLSRRVTLDGEANATNPQVLHISATPASTRRITTRPRLENAQDIQSSLFSSTSDNARNHDDNVEVGTDGLDNDNNNVDINDGLDNDNNNVDINDNDFDIINDNNEIDLDDNNNANINHNNDNDVDNHHDDNVDFNNALDGDDNRVDNDNNAVDNADNSVDNNDDIDNESLNLYQHQNGFFTRALQSDNDPGYEVTLMEASKAKCYHLGSKTMMDKIFSVIKSFAVFVKFSSPANSTESELCNDLLLIHVRNVELTDKKGGRKEMDQLDCSKVTLFARNRRHAVRLTRSMIKAFRASTFGDDRFTDQYECDYIGIADDEDAVGNFKKKIEEEREKLTLEMQTGVSLL